MRLNIVLISWLLLGLGCHDSDTVLLPDPVPQDAYQYTAFDSEGNMIVEGSLVLRIDGTQVTGEWLLDTRIDVVPPQTAHPTGDGQLVGFVDEDQISLNLHPMYNDANLYLDGKLADGAITGEWYFATILGAVDGGDFLATRN